MKIAASKISSLFLALALIGLLGACTQHKKKGPLEKTGERIDEIADNVRDGDPVFHKKGPLEKTGEAIDDSLK